MPSASRQKSKAKPAARKLAPARKTPAVKHAKPAPKKSPPPAAKSSKSSTAKSGSKAVPKEAASPTASIPLVRRADGRVHVLSLSFVRDGDEFMARMESDAGQITELKNRSLDQLLTLVASELEDQLE
jgi:hypothetical protein